MKAPKKPKFKAMPKAPKMKGSDASWENYKKNSERVAAENLKKKNAYEKELKAYEAEIKRREAIKSQAKDKDAKSKL